MPATTGPAMAARLAQRAGFGATAEELATLDGLDGAAVVERLTADAPEDPGVSATPPPTLAPQPRRAESPEERQELARLARTQGDALAVWWLDRLVASRQPWREKRTFLWLDHWATSIRKVKSAPAMLQHYTTLRELGGGDFGELARSMVRDPALMLWLDASGNTAAAPNENLARELMELFTLGIGNYTEQDVREGALALTGWGLRGLRTGDLEPSFRARAHAPGPQTVLGTTADFSDAELVDLLVSQPQSPRYLATRFWGRLVAASAPPQESLVRAAAAYGPGRDVTAMLRSILTDPQVADSASVLVKQPVEYLVGALRALRVRPSQLEPAGQKMLLRSLRELGQVPFAPPSVGGWPAGAAWLSTSSARARIGLAGQLADKADLNDLTAAAQGERVDVAARRLGVLAWTDRTRAVLGEQARDPRQLMAAALLAPEYAVNA